MFYLLVLPVDGDQRAHTEEEETFIDNYELIKRFRFGMIWRTLYGMQKREHVTKNKSSQWQRICSNQQFQQ